MTKRRYLFFDIDGTLTAGGYGHDVVPASVFDALDKLRAAGHLVAIATGRAHAMAVGRMRELGFENMVSDGGYGVTIEGELQGITPLPHEDIVALVDECREKGHPWGLQIDDSDCRVVPDERFQEATDDVYLRTRVVLGLDPRDYDKIYKAYVACRHPEELEIEALRRLPWCRFHDDYLFVEPTDKAFGIRQVCDHFGAPYEQVVVFGDAMNDLSMFIDDWTCVAMGSAVDELKARADYVTDAPEDDGIYHACEALGLFDPVDE